MELGFATFCFMLTEFYLFINLFQHIFLSLDESHAKINP